MLTKLEKPYPGCRARWQCWTCDDAQKHGVCQHSLFHTKRTGGCDFPERYKLLSNGQKRKRGAPRKTMPALTKQLGDMVPSMLPALPASDQGLLSAGDNVIAALPEPDRRSTRQRVEKVVESL